MAEVEFEDNCREIKGYLDTVRQCRQQLHRLPAAVTEVMELLRNATRLLDDLCSFEDAPPGLQEQCARARSQVSSFRDGDELRVLSEAIQTSVHFRLGRMEELAQTAYGECGRRREARAKYLSDVGGRRAFQLSSPNPVRVLRHKEEYTASDFNYRAACTELARFRFEEMGSVQADFFCGYSGIFAILTNALNLPVNSLATDPPPAPAATVTRLRLRDRLVAADTALPQPDTPRQSDGSANRRSAAGASTAPALSAQEVHGYQRRLSASPPSCGANSVPGGAGDVVDGIPLHDAAAAAPYVQAAAHYQPQGQQQQPRQPQYVPRPVSAPLQPQAMAAAAEAAAVAEVRHTRPHPPQPASGSPSPPVPSTSLPRRSTCSSAHHFDELSSGLASSHRALGTHGEYSFLGALDDAE